MIVIVDDSKYFKEIVECISKVFENNHIHYKTAEKISNNDNYLYFFINTNNIKNPPKNYIIYNFEQLGTSIKKNEKEIGYNDKFFKKFRDAKKVFDYSKENIKLLESKNIKAEFLPYSWFPDMIKDHKVPKITYFSFIGLLNEKRVKFLKPMFSYCKDKNYNIFISNNCWGEDYYTEILRSWVSFNVHYYEKNTILELHRIINLIVNKVYVISETSDDKYLDECYKNLVTWIDSNKENHQLELFSDFLNLEEEERDEILEKRKQDMINMPSFKNNIENILVFYLKSLEK